MTNFKTTITNSDNRKYTYWFDLSMYTVKVQDPEGLYEITEYWHTNGKNVYGDVKTKIDRNGNRTSYETDNMGNVTQITNPDLSKRYYTYDINNNLTSETDEMGRKTFYIYNDAKTQLLKIVKPINGTDVYVEGTSNTAGFAITSYTYYTKTEAQNLFNCNAEGLLKTSVDPEGTILTYAYNQNGDVVSIKDNQNNITSFGYNDIGLKIAETSPNGDHTNYNYDDNGTLIRITQQGNKVTRYVYDNKGNIVKEIQPNQYQPEHDDFESNDYTGNYGTRYEWYDNGLQKAIIDAENNRTEFEWDKYGNMVEKKNPNGSIYCYEYDVMDRLIKTCFKEDIESNQMFLFEKGYSILPNGRTQITDTRWLNASEKAISVTISDYAGRVTEVQQPDGTKTFKHYNPDGSLLLYIAANGAISHFYYNGLGILSSKWVPVAVQNGETMYSWTSYSYDKTGRKLEEKVGRNLVKLNQTTANTFSKYFQYDSIGRLNQITDSENRKTCYEYDSNGNITLEAIYSDNTHSNVTEYSYNYLNKAVWKKQHIRTGDIYGNEYDDNSDTILTTSFYYDANGNLISITNPDNITTVYTYDNLNRQLTVSSPSQDEYGNSVIATSSSTYTWDGKIKTQTDAKGNTTQFFYDSRMLLIKKINVLNGTTLYGYDRGGRKIVEVSPENYIEGSPISNMERTEFTYDNMDRLIAQILKYQEYTLYSGSWVTNWVDVVSAAYRYDSLGNIIKSLDALGYQSGIGSTMSEKIITGYGTISKYNLAGMLETVLDAESKERNLPYTIQYKYNGLLQNTEQYHPDGTIQSYTYDGMGNVLTISVNGSIKKEITYDRLGNVIQEKDAKGNKTISTWNSFNNLSCVITPGDDTIPSLTKTLQYDISGNLKNIQDSMGKVEFFLYDNQGRNISSTTQKNDGIQSINHTVKYDIIGNKRFETDGNGNIYEYNYDALNRLIQTGKTVNGLIKTSTIDYDANGNKKVETDWLGNTVQMEYDGINRLIEIKNQFGDIIEQIEYNHNNAQIRSHDALHNITVFQYDKNQRLKGQYDAEGHFTGQTYDNRGNISTKRDGNGNITTYLYDAENRLQSVRNSLGETTFYTYDQNGNMVTQTDGNNNTTTFEYNAANLLVKRIDPQGIGVAAKTESYTYNANGVIAGKTDRNQTVTQYSYDIHGRLLSEDVGGQTQIYTYDNNGNLLTATDSTGTTTRVYDEENRVIEKTVPNLGKSEYRYDIITNVPQGFVAEETEDPTEDVTRRVYDKAGRLVQVITNGQITAYSYYSNGNRLSVIYPDGSNEYYEYDGNNNVTLLENRKADRSLMESYAYTYDGAGNQTIKTDSKGTTFYTYDIINRLKKVQEPNGRITEYSYDKAGNRKSESITAGTETVVTSYTYNEQNRLTKTKTVTSQSKEETVYNYDNNGNLYTKVKSISVPKSQQASPDTFLQVNIIRKGEAEDKDISFYSYDKRNQLVKLVEGSNTSIYQYNAEGYRTEKNVNGQITRYLYEADKVIYEADENNTVTARNFYGINLIARQTGGEILYYMYNAHGDVTALIDAIGNIAATYYYDAFGNIVETNENAGLINPFRYAGYQYDDETELYYLNARYYDAEIARFIQEDTYRGQVDDPLSLNLYTYCHNNPIMYVDPTGHTQWDIDHLSSADYAKLEDIWDQYATTNDPKIHDLLHAQAEAIRDQYRQDTNFVGSADGHTYVANETSSGTQYDLYNPDVKHLNNAAITSEASGLPLDVHDPRISGNTIHVNQNVKPTNTITPTQGTGNAVSVSEAEVIFIAKMKSVGMDYDKAYDLTTALRNNNGKLTEQQYRNFGFADEFGMAYAELQYKLVKEGMTVEQIDYLNSSERLSQAISLAACQLVASGFSIRGTGSVANRTPKLGTETYYRTMSKADYDTFLKTGKIPATGETFVSPTKSFSEGYNGVTVEFKVNAGTTNQLVNVGVRDTSGIVKNTYSNMPTVGKGWTSNNAYFKGEDGQINIGLGKGTGLDIFNNNIVEFKAVGGR